MSHPRRNGQVLLRKLELRQSSSCFWTPHWSILFMSVVFYSLCPLSFCSNMFMFCKWSPKPWHLCFNSLILWERCGWCASVYLSCELITLQPTVSAPATIVSILSWIKQQQDSLETMCTFTKCVFCTWIHPVWNKGGKQQKLFMEKYSSLTFHGPSVISL